MALQSPRNAYGSPPLARVVATLTAAILHQEVSAGGVAPVGVNHLPSGVIFHTAGTFTWTDASGTTVATVVTAESLGIWCPIAPAAIQVTSVPAVTVFWHRGATKTP